MMLRDVSTNFSVIAESEKITRHRKIALLRVYLDQIQLVFLDTEALETPLSEIDRQLASDLYDQIERHLRQLLNEQRIEQEKE